MLKPDYRGLLIEAYRLVFADQVIQQPPAVRECYFIVWRLFVVSNVRYQRQLQTNHEIKGSGVQGLPTLTAWQVTVWLH